LDVASEYGRNIHAQSNVYLSHFDGERIVRHLGFVLDGTCCVEFSAHNTGRAAVACDCDRVVRLFPSPARDLTPLLPAGAVAKSAFLAENAGHFRGLYENGARLSDTWRGIVCQFGLCRFYLKNLEDFTVVNNVCVNKTYNFLSGKPAVVLDIGMNVAINTIFFSSLPHVVEVHGYEPFAAPFARAVENLALNGDHAKKAFPHHCGVGARDETLKVVVDSRFTIGTSVRGLAQGEPEEIELIGAPDLFRGLRERATRRGALFVAKIDCEGSEFPIFAALIAEGLLDSPDIYLLQWHKRWSADLSQRDLIEPLIAAGYVVVDRSVDADLATGQLYAVK
jgi:FkbM family methyltransferase